VFGSQCSPHATQNPFSLEISGLAAWLDSSAARLDSVLGRHSAASWAAAAMASVMEDVADALSISLVAFELLAPARPVPNPSLQKLPNRPPLV